MARVLFSGMVSQARGALGQTTWRTTRKDPTRPAPPLNTDAGGVVFARFNGVDAVRQRIEPPYSRTTAQAKSRDALAAAVLSWQTDLTDAQRLAWNEFARVYPTSGSTSHKRLRSGANAFMRAHATQGYFGGAFLLDPPPDQNVTQLTGFSIVSAASDGAPITVTLDQHGTAAFEEIHIFATPPVSPGLLKPWRLLQWIAAIPTAAVYPYDISADYAAIWGTPTAGTRIGLQAVMHRQTNAALSLRQKATAIVTQGDAMLQTTVTLTHSDIVDLPSTPITVVPTPPPGKTIVPIAALLRTSNPFTAYSGFDDGASLWLGNDAAQYDYLLSPAAELASDGDTDLSTLLGGHADNFSLTLQHMVIHIVPGFGSKPLKSGSNLHAALKLFLVDQADPLTNGDPANTLTLTVFYALAP